MERPSASTSWRPDRASTERGGASRAAPRGWPLQGGPHARSLCLFVTADRLGLARRGSIVEAETGDRTQEAPVADLDVRLVDYSFGFSAPLQAGSQRIRVVNSGSEPHEIGIVKLLPGKTIEDVRAWARNPAEEPPLDLRDLGGVTSLASGEEAYFDMELTPASTRFSASSRLRTADPTSITA